MLGGVRLKVSYTHEKTCFAYISSKYSSNRDESQSIQVLYKDKQILLWVIFSSNVGEGLISINPIFSRLVGLDEGCDVFASPHSDVKILDELYIDTDSPDDQEILEHNVSLLQLRILDQLRLVVANQKAIVWISVSLPVIFTPKQTGLLVNHSKVIVEMDIFKQFHKPPPTVEPKQEPKFKNIGQINDAMLKPYLNPPKNLVLRALPIECDGKKNLIHPYTVYVHEDLIEENYKTTIDILATIESIPSITTDKDNDEATLVNVCVEVIPIDSVIYKSLCHEMYNEFIPTILITKSLNSIVNIENGVKVILRIIGEEVEQPDHIDITSYSDEEHLESDVMERFKSCVIENTHKGKKFLINHDLVKQNLAISTGYLQFKLKPDRLKYTLLNSECFRQCTVSVKCLKESDLKGSKPLVFNPDLDNKVFCRTMNSVEKLVEDAVAHLYFEIHRDANFKGVSEIKSNVLITGLSGTGKSAICQIIQKELTVWSYTLHCRALKGRKDIPEALSKAILMCQEHSPAVLICDDVDSLVPPNLEGSSPQDIAYYQRLAVVIKHQLQSCAGVSVLMTATTVNSLHPTLKQFNGKPLFTAHFDIVELGQDERTELFKYLLNERIRTDFTVEDDDVTTLAVETSGSSVRDVIDHFNKIIFRAVKKKRANPKETKTRLLEPKKEKENNQILDVWAPVGGLKEVKQRLTEAIFWPLMYPALFPSHSCGILLYGPPGTGKSFLGSRLAAAHQFNFIAVKGPELLSKYIGQSEKAVRDIFDRAEMKKPCILFFDEFDSLAPKRGHDSTGVTDRVVNQLLARLDGAEGGAAGPVLCATSRPDLLDPALLRPGRLHTHLYTSPPDQEDRLEVLKSLARDVTISDEVDLEDISKRTEGFSPADLKSLLVTAQLTSLEEQLLNKTESSEIKSVVVSAKDMEAALQDTRPSLSPEQRRFYDMVYKRFRGESLASEERVMSAEFYKQRVTLA